MIRIPYSDRSYAVDLRASYRLIRGTRGEHLADAVVTVEDGYRAGIHDCLRLRHRAHDPGAQARDVPRQAQHAVRLMPPQVGAYQAIGEEVRVGRGNTNGAEHRFAEIDQPISIDGRRYHRFIYLQNRKMAALGRAFSNRFLTTQV